MIIFNDNGIFKIDTANSSYVMALQNNILYHIYWGKKISNIERTLDQMIPLKGSSFSALDEDVRWGRSSDIMPMEYPTYGSPDLRTPALHIRYDDGTSATALRYKSHKITKGKPILKGLPATYVEGDDNVETLSITLVDEFRKIEVILNYTCWYDYDAIARSNVIINHSKKPLSVISAYSTAFDITDCTDYDMLNLFGVWGRERSPERLTLRHGIQMIDSKRGASSHNQNPFLAVLSKNSDEKQGDVFGVNLIYSGNFAGGVEMDGYNTGRLFMGINPFDFGYMVNSDEEFFTPEAVMVYSNSGLSGMSRLYHNLYRNRICRGKYRDIERPVLINNWEATYFDFDEEKLVCIANKAKDIGVDLFVLDDGWFRVRDCEIGSLGDWKVNKKKLPNGLNGLCEKINELGIKFGLWFEPEMVSEDSDLFRQHPDWCLHIDGKKSSLGRNQLTLDLSRKEVREYIIGFLSSILDSANIEYIKWDMNRHMSEIGSSGFSSEHQSEIAHRYILGLYEILETITQKYPNVLFEGCSGGGGRFDAGMLYYMPQIWTSDVTDAKERLKLQYGTSIVYPYSSMGAHVSAVPNHQVYRTTPFEMRGNVALVGQFGYELDISKLSEEELEMCKKQIAFYKKYGSFIHNADCYRICSPFESDISVIEFLSKDKSMVIVNIASCNALPNAPFTRIKLQGLDEDAVYSNIDNNIQMTGSELCTIGIPFVNEREYYSSFMIFTKNIGVE